MWRYVLPLLVLAGPLAAEQKTFDFVGIDSIDARNGVTVNVVPGDEISIVADASKGDVDQVIIRKFGPWLAINRSTRWFIFPYGRTDEIVVTITLPELRNIKAFDTATATADGFSGESIRIEALEGGTVTVDNIDYADVILNATESGVLTVTGDCGTAVADAVFGAEVNAGDLVCANVAAATRRGGVLEVQATDLVSTDDTSGGTINVLGSPEVVEHLPGMEPDKEEVDG